MVQLNFINYSTIFQFILNYVFSFITLDLHHHHLYRRITFKQEHNGELEDGQPLVDPFEDELSDEEQKGCIIFVSNVPSD